MPPERPDDLLRIELEAGERRFLRVAINHWGGPMCVTEELTAVLGFAAKHAWQGASTRIHLHRGEPLTRADWLAALAAAEIAFASAVYRGASDFLPCTGISDEDGIRILRSVQRKIAPQVCSIIGRGVGETYFDGC